MTTLDSEQVRRAVTDALDESTAPVDIPALRRAIIALATQVDLFRADVAEDLSHLNDQAIQNQNDMKAAIEALAADMKSTRRTMVGAAISVVLIILGAAFRILISG